MLLKEREEPPEAIPGQGEVEMSEGNQDSVQEQLSELTQQVIHVIQACNEEKEVLEDEFDSVRNGIMIMESRIQPEKVRIDSEVSGVGSMMQLQQVVLQELRSGVQILQSQDNQIVSEATELLAGFRKELEAQCKHIMDNTLQLVVVENSNQSIQKGLSEMTKRIDEVNKIMASITTSLKDIPSKRGLRQHAQVMEDQIAQVEEVDTGLTMAVEGYGFSDSAPYEFRPSGSQPGPSGTRPVPLDGNVHPSRKRHFYDDSVSSLRDTDSASTWFGIRGGARHGNAGDSNAGNGNGGASGGGPPGDPLPSDHGGAGGRRMSRQQRGIRELEFAKPIKIEVPKRFEVRPGEDCDTWWALVQVYINDKPETFPKDERTIDWIGSLMNKDAVAWHIQWLEGTLNGTHPKSMTGYIDALKLRFEDRDAKDEAFAELEKVRYNRCIRDMFTQIQMSNDEALVTGAAFQKLILERLPHKILEQMHTIDLTAKTDAELYSIITNAGRTAEKWDEARKNLGLKTSLREKVDKYQFHFGKKSK